MRKHKEHTTLPQQDKQESNEEQLSYQHIIPFLKKYYGWVILFGILVFGFTLRTYHLDYPVIGYHNWKETHYLTEARNFERDGFFAHGFFIPAWDYPTLDYNKTAAVWGDPAGVHSDSFPTGPVLTSVLFKIFGVKVSVARMFSIISILAAIVMLYLLVKELFKREDMAIVAAFIAAALPLLVFFGRQAAELVNINLFFMIACLYFYVVWLRTRRGKHLIATSIFLALTLLTKYDFLYVIIPIVLLFPYKDFFKTCIKDLQERKISVYFVCLAILALVPGWLLYTKYIATKIGSPLVADAINFSIIFESEWWQSVKLYLIDNYTITGGIFALLGIAVLFIFYNKQSVGQKFMVYSILGAIPWIWFVSGYLKGHAYHQYPIVHLVIMAMAFFIMFIAITVEKIVKHGKSIARWITIVLLLLVFLYNPMFTGGNVFTSINRQFDTQFIGLDVAGSYIKEHSRQNERIVFPSHQSYGVLWHADRKGFGKGWGSPEAMRYAEEERNVTWVFVYQWGMSIFQEKERLDYISQHYALKQFAFQQDGQNSRPVYFLFKKGGSFNLSQLNSMLGEQPVNNRDYEYTIGTNRLLYINLP